MNDPDGLSVQGRLELRTGLLSSMKSFTVIRLAERVLANIETIQSRGLTAKYFAKVWKFCGAYEREMLESRWAGLGSRLQIAKANCLDARHDFNLLDIVELIEEGKQEPDSVLLQEIRTIKKRLVEYYMGADNKSITFEAWLTKKGGASICHICNKQITVAHTFPLKENDPDPTGIMAFVEDSETTGERVYIHDVCKPCAKELVSRNLATISNVGRKGDEELEYIAPLTYLDMSEIRLSKIKKEQ